jgi:hypothetical protein
MNNSTKEVILQLKEVKEQKGLTCQNISDQCETNGESVGLTTVRRFFAKGSEEKPGSFRARTVNAIFRAVVGSDDTALSKAENAAINSVIEMNDRVLAEKDAIIADLRKELVAMQVRVDTLTEVIRVAVATAAQH